MTTLAEVAVRFKGDVGQLVQDAQAEGSKAGDAAGGTFSSSFGTKLQGALGTALGASLAVASKGMLDLDSATKQYGADTGATADQQAKAAQIANQFFASSTEGYDAILGVMGKLQTEQGLTQDQAKALTQSYLDYAKVTKQDPTTATTAFTEVIHAWGLQASDATDIQDKLVKSQQEYGTSATASQAALAQLAPQMKALGLSVDDTIGFINQFQKAGLSADQSTAALSHAIAGLKPGQNLNDLVAGIEKIQDPTERAQAAMDLFGKRGGAALSNLTGSYKDFEVTTEQAAGTVDTAAKDIDSSIENQVVIGLHHLQSVLVDVLGPAGPLLTGVSGIASMSKGLRDLGIPIPGVEEAMKALGLSTKETGDAAAVAAGEEDGLALSEDAAGASAEGAATKTTLFGTALKALPWVLVLAGAAQLVDRLSHLDDTIGMFTGGEASRLKATMAQMTDQFGVTADSTGPMGDAFRKLLEQYHELVPQTDFLHSSLAGLDPVAQQLIAAMRATYTGANDLTGAVHDQGFAVDDVTKAWSNTYVEAQRYQNSARDSGNATDRVTIAALAMGQAYAASRDPIAETASGLDNVLAAAQTAAAGIPPAVQKGLGAAIVFGKTAGIGTVDAFAQGIAAERQKPVDEMTSLVDLMKHPMTTMQETSKLLGELTGKTLAEGLHSSDPVVRAQAEATKQAIIDRLDELKAGTGPIGKSGMAELAKGLHSGDADVRREAGYIEGVIESKLSFTKDAASWGKKTGDAWVGGLTSSIAGATQRIIGAVAYAKGPLVASSPPGPESPLHLIDVWGYRTGMAWVDNFVKALATAKGATQTQLAALSSLFVGADGSVFSSTVAPNAGVTVGPGPAAAAAKAQADALAQAKVDSLELAKNDLTRQLTNAALTDEQKAQLNAQIAGIQAQEDAISAAQQQVSTATDYVAQLQAAHASTSSILDATNMLIDAQKTLNGLVAAGSPAPIGPAGATPAQQQAATAQAKLDTLEIAKADLQRKQDALGITDAMKAQNALAIAALQSQIDGIQNQENAITDAQKQVSVTADLVDQLKIANASQDDITAAINASITAQKTLNALVATAAGTPGAPPPGPGTGTPGAPPATYGQVPPGSLAGGLGSGGLWIPDINHTNGGNPTWQALDPSIYPTAGQNPTYGNDTTGGPTGGIQIHGDININNPAPEPASKSAKKALQDLALFGVTS